MKSSLDVTAADVGDEKRRRTPAGRLVYPARLR
jgi:hypothetical protein